MGFWAIIPVKPLRRGKSRLSGVLDENGRTALNTCLLQNTLAALAGVPEIDHTLIISRDPQALSIARTFGAQTLLERSGSNLNRALEIATAIVRRSAHRGLLILPADLPLLRSHDIADLLATASRPPVISIVPDRHGEGTNALLVSPPGMLRYSFGVGSFRRHCEAAQQCEAKLQVVHNPVIALDLDIPEDLDLVRGGLNDQIQLYGRDLAENNLSNSSTQIMLDYKRRCLDLIPQLKGVTNVGQE